MNKVQTFNIPSGKNRRDFLKQMGLGILSTQLVSCGPSSHTNQGTDSTASKQQDLNMPRYRIALQLYTVRDQIAQDLTGTLKRIADIGFTHVETAFWPEGVTHDRASGLLRDAGLTPVSSHIELPVDAASKKALVDIARTYGCNHLIWHGWPEDPRYQSEAGTIELIRLYNEAAQLATDNGLQFGLHNHWWEFRNKPGGKRVFDFWMHDLNPGVFLELDTYWVKVAGYDPASVIREAGSRVKFLHIKDGPAQWHENLAQDNPDPMTAVGKGKQDMPAILEAAKDQVDWLVIEMDKVDGDVFALLNESLTTLKRLSGI